MARVRRYGPLVVAALVLLASAGVSLGVGVGAGPGTGVSADAAAGAGADTGTHTDGGAERGSTTTGVALPDRPSVDVASFDAPTRDGVARVDGERFDTLRAALDAAAPGDIVRLRGRFEERVTVETPNVTIDGGGPDETVIDGGGEGTVLSVNATNVTVRSLRVRGAGREASGNDAAVWLAGHGSRLLDSRVTDTTFGVWVDGVADVEVVNNTIVGRESVTPLTKRGNGIQLYRATGAYVAGNRITDVRDGIYYSWASGVVAEDNAMWDIRYGVHYMYSDGCTLAENTAVGNDVGYALMVSQDLHILNNVAADNAGQSGHGILLKSIDRTEVRGNHFVGNEHGVFLFNSLDNALADNLVAGNDVGVYLAAGSVRERVTNNTFVRNGLPVQAEIGAQVAWNESVGNYWAGAGVRDVDDDGISETRYRPAGMVQHLTGDHPGAALFTGSPAFEVIRLAERTLPVVEAPGVVDYRPLADPPHDWRRYYDRDH